VTVTAPRAADPIRVLVVDDDVRLTAVLTEYLAQFGFSVRAAARPSDGLRALAADAPDLVVLDVMLPEMDGLAVCRKVRESSRVPIIMLTARGDVSDR
jgi:DNA-binding response OmpR family regulator